MKVKNDFKEGKIKTRVKTRVKNRFGDINQSYKRVFIGIIKSVINFLPKYSYYLFRGVGRWCR